MGLSLKRPRLALDEKGHPKGEKDQLPVTISLGVTCMENEPSVDAETLIQRADQRLYEAKRAGRNRVAPSPAEIKK